MSARYFSNMLLGFSLRILLGIHSKICSEILSLTFIFSKNFSRNFYRNIYATFSRCCLFTNTSTQRKCSMDFIQGLFLEFHQKFVNDFFYNFHQTKEIIQIFLQVFFQRFWIEFLLYFPWYSADFPPRVFFSIIPQRRYLRNLFFKFSKFSKVLLNILQEFLAKLCTKCTSVFLQEFQERIFSVVFSLILQKFL